jgi:hypothetical protein
MSSDNGIMTNVQVKTFDGTQQTFGAFWFYLTALLMTKNLLDALMPEFENELPESEYAESQNAKQKKNAEKNRMVMGYLGITLTSPKWMIKVEKTKSEKWPSGLAYEVAKALKKRYRPNDMLSKAEQKTKLGLLRLRQGQDPDDFGTAIESLEIEYRNNFSEDDKVSALVSAAGPQYGATILNEMERLESLEGGEVTCDALIEKLCKLWRVSGSGKGVKPSELELADPGYFAQNKSCFYCKEKGHLKSDCPKLVGKQPQGKKCEYPGCTMQAGHSTENCWEDPKNERNRPANWVSRIKKNPDGPPEPSTVEIFL